MTLSALLSFQGLGNAWNASGLRSFWRRDGSFVAVGLFICLLAIAPYLVFGQDAHVSVMDTLNINFAWYKVLADTGLQLAPPSTPVPPFMNGMPRVGFGSEYNLLLWLVSWFGPFPAYVLNECLIRAVAFLGLYGLITRHLLPNPPESQGGSRWVATLAASSFALLPFWLAGGLAIAGQPMVLLALMNFQQKRYRLVSTVMLLLQAAHGYLAFSIFFVPALGLIGLWRWIRDRAFPTGYWLGLTGYVALLVGVEHQFIREVLYPSFTSYRTEFALTRVDLAGAQALFKSAILQGQPHAETSPLPVILPCVALALIASLLIKQWPRRLAFYTLTVAFLLSCAWFAYTQSLYFRLDAHWPLLQQLNLSRFFILQPMLLSLMFALALDGIRQLPVHRIHQTLWITAAGLAQIALLLTHAVPYRAWFHLEPLHKIYGFPVHTSYREFVSHALFDQLKAYIGKPLHEYRVIHVGLDPAVSQLNGLWTVDGYLTYYPLSYKHAFRKVFEAELAEPWCGYCRLEFDGWGSRCYILPDWSADKYVDFADFDRFGIRKHTFGALDLTLNPKQLVALRADYVLSTVELKHGDHYGLRFLKHFEHRESPYELFLYQVKRLPSSSK